MADNNTSFALSPCIFIGIGTNGWRILDDLRQLLFEEFGVGGLPCFRYIAIESNAGRLPDDSFLPYVPKPYETVRPVYITIPDINVIRKRIDPNREQEFKPGLKDWLDLRLIERGNKSYQSGAGNSRHAGRLCLWENWSEVKQQITRAYEEITTVRSRQDADGFLREAYLARKMSGMLVPTENLVSTAPRIYIFGTLCGGTCGGAFLDIAYFVSDLMGVGRSRVMRNARDPEVIGMFTIVDTIRVSQPNLQANVANCWGALRELDFYFHPESVYSARFPDNTVIKTRDEPFDTVYLVAMRNMAGAGFTGEDYHGLTQMCAMNLFTEVVAGMAARKDENRVNLRATAVGFLQPNQNGHIRAFSTFGISAIWYPRYRIAKAINRHLGVEMCVGWLGGKDFPAARIEGECKNAWDALVGRVRGSLLGTVEGAHCNVNLPTEVGSLLERHQVEFEAVDEYGLDDFTVNFPDAHCPFSQRLANPDGAYYRKIALAENSVLRDLKSDVEACLTDYLRAHTFAETRFYLDGLVKLVAQDEQIIPDELAAFSQRMDFSLAHDVHRDIWSQALFLRDAAVKEYKQAIWDEFKYRVVSHLELIRDHFVKRILRSFQPESIALAGRIARAENRLTSCCNTCETEKAQQIDFHHPGNIIPISAGKPFTIDDDVETGAAEILKTTDRLRLRRLFLGDENPLLLLETRPVRDLVGLTDQCFDTLSQLITTRFHIGREALASLQNRIENLVQSSVPYVEAVSSFKPLATAQSPNFLFCHDPEAARSLADLTESFLATARYTSAPSPLDHFVIFYQEVPGLAISDLAIADFASHLLDDVENSPDKVATHYTHQMGEKMFDLKAIRDFELVARWLGAMRYLAPDLFRTVGGQVCLEYETRQGLKRDLPIDNAAAVRQYIETYGGEPLLKIFSNHIRALGKPILLQRMDARKNEAQTPNARKLIQDDHENILAAIVAEGPLKNGIRLAFSYSHGDQKLRDQLETHLRLLQRQGLISTWHDRKIMPGDKWGGVIDNNFTRSDLILLLVSADFLASDYCYEMEMKSALERQARGEAKVVPIILRACNWQSGPLGKLQAIPKDGRPITSWPNQDEAWNEVTGAIRRLLEPPIEQKENLLLKRLILHNIRCFTEIDLDFSSGSNCRQFLLLLGDNSVGKTTILRSMALGLCDESAAAGLLSKLAGDFLRDGTSHGSITVDLSTATSTKVWRVQTKFRRATDGKVSLVRQIPPDFPANQLFVCGYGAARRSFGTADYSGYAPQYSLATLFNYEATMQNPELILRRIFGRSLGLPEITRQIDEVMLLAPGSTTIEESGITIRGPWGDLSPVGAMGDGYQATVAWIVDLLGWVLLHDENSLLTNPSGIVLIDEIDQHLHPKWQREIVRQLLQQFPKMQFIATSHAPMCALGMTALDDGIGGLVTLCRTGETVQAGLAPLPKGKRADEVLTSPLFGLFSASAFDISADLERLSSLTTKAHLSPAEAQECDLLREKLRGALGPFKTELEKRVHAAVRQGMEAELREDLASGRVSRETLDLKISEQAKLLLGLNVKG
jgi:energy-coupling factor transporter ATP-binding protein EcfA2